MERSDRVASTPGPGKEETVADRGRVLTRGEHRGQSDSVLSAVEREGPVSIYTEPISSRYKCFKKHTLQPSQWIYSHNIKREKDWEWIQTWFFPGCMGPMCPGGPPNGLGPKPGTEHART